MLINWLEFVGIQHFSTCTG